MVHRILGLTVCFIIKNKIHDFLGHRGGILLLSRLADVHVVLENSLAGDSFFKHMVEVLKLKFELRGSLLFIRSSRWDLIQQLLHKTTDYHTLLLGKFILMLGSVVWFRSIFRRIAEGVDHVHNSHHFQQNWVMDLISFYTNGVSISGINLFLILGIDYWEVGLFD